MSSLRGGLLGCTLGLLALGSTLAEESATSPSPSPAADAPTFLDSVTVSATRGETAVGDAPGSVAVIDRRQVEETLAADSRDLLRYEPGVYVASDPTRLGLGGFVLRGLGGNRVLTRVDGVPTAEQFSFGPLSAPPTFLDLEAVQTVEILKSSASALYGSDALAGVVSVATRDPGDYLGGARSAWGGRLGFDGRSERGSASLFGAFGGRSWQGSLTASFSQGGELDNQGEVDSADFSRTAANPQDREEGQWLAKAMHLGSGSSWTRIGLEGYRGDTDTDVLSSQGVVDSSSLFPPGSTFTVDTRVFDAVDTSERDRLSIEHGRTFPLLGDLTGRLFFQQAEARQETLEHRVTVQGGGFLGPLRTTEVARTGLFSFEQESLGGEAQAVRALGAAGRHRLTYGVSYLVDRFDQLRDREDVNLATGRPVPGSLVFPTKYFPESEVEQVGAFVQAEIELAGGRLQVIPGLRFDRFALDADQTDSTYLSGNAGIDTPADSSDQAVSPRLGVVFAATERQTLMASWSQGFRAPPFSDINNGFTNVAQGYTTLPNPNLDPETSDSYELGWRLALPKGALSVAVFENRYEGFIDTIALGVNPTTGLLEFQPQNLSDVEISGVEVGGEARFGDFRLRGALSVIEGEDQTTGEPLTSVPPSKAVVGLAWRGFAGRFGTELAVTMADDKDEGDLDASGAPLFAAPGYELVDWTASWRFSERFELFAGVTNLLDETYWDWGAARGLPAGSTVLDRYSAPGRSVTAALRWRLAGATP